MEVERGYTVCDNGTSKLRRGPQVTGTESTIGIPITCPGGSRPVALFHTHPNGTPISTRDIATMKEKRLPVCIKARGKIRCWKEKK